MGSLLIEVYLYIQGFKPLLQPFYFGYSVSLIDLFTEIVPADIFTCTVGFDDPLCNFVFLTSICTTSLLSHLDLLSPKERL